MAWLFPILKPAGMSPKHLTHICDNLEWKNLLLIIAGLFYRPLSAEVALIA